MALKKKSLKEIASENAQVTKGTSKNQEVLKEGIPNDHSVKHLTNDRVVGVSLGITRNMGDYQSLRVDCWLTDTVEDNETVEQAYERIIGQVDKVLQDTVNSYSE